MKIATQPSALADLKSGFRFYKRKEADLGTYFLDHLYADIDSLHLLAGIHPIHFGKFHRLLSKRFPYGIYHSVEEDQVQVRAILDLRRDPEWLARKMKRLG